jgi:polar amino acid transport system substrate-binding protein
VVAVRVQAERCHAVRVSSNQGDSFFRAAARVARAGLRVCVFLWAALAITAAYAQSAQNFSPREGGFSTNDVRVATIERPPFMMQTDAGPVGFSIDLWQALSRQTGFRTEFVVTQSFAEMLGLVRDAKVDAAIANITITSAREAAMDFSQPMFDAGLKVMVPATGTSVGLLGALFNLEMLGLIALSFLLLFGAANLMWLFERKHQPYFEYPYKEGMFRSFWWALNVIVNGGFEERIPQSPKGRVFAVFLVFASLFIVSAFVAKITATLTVGELQAQIRGYTDLYDKRVGTTEGSTASAFLKSHAIAHRTFKTTDDLFDAVSRKRLDAVVHDAPLLEYFAATRGNGRVQVVGRMLRPEKYGIALQQDSPLRETVDRALLKLREDGTFERLRARWFD